MSPTFEALATLLSGARDPALPVARDGDDLVRFDAFRARVASLVAGLASPPGSHGRWLVVTESGLDFAASLLAIWHAGGVAVLPPNGQPGTLAELAQEAVGLLGDVESPPAGLPVVRPKELHGPVSRARFSALDPARPCLELLSSGTTSARKRCSKTLSQLDTELAALETCFGPNAGEAEILGSVSHQHVYGLLVRVLWPLAAGRVFHPRAILHPEEIAARIPDGRQAVLVSVPALIRRLVRRPVLDGLAPRLREVFSSGGPLEEASADAFAAVWGRAPLEVYGSTESGGIAWRRQEPGPARLDWQPLPGVAIAIDEATQCLRVTSSFASPLADPEPLRMEDRAELRPEGTFRLLGRADRVVKIAEKAVSLPELEQHLCEHPWIDAAACLRLERDGDARLGAVVIPSGEGRAALAEVGRANVARVLAQHLATRWDRVLLPRSWRYVDVLPLDAQGKLSHAALAALFHRETAKPVREVELLEEICEPDAVVRRLRVPDTLASLEGHFPGFPVVPGVVQLQWAFAAAREGLGIVDAAERIDRLKFKRLLRPGDVLTLRVERTPDGRGFEFRAFEGAVEISSGRVIVERAGSTP